MMPGSELNNQYTAGFSAGRRITTRPFTHGSILSAPQIADNSPAALYEYGWEWQVEKINDTEEVLQDDGESRSYYGGGYNFGSGSTHVVQQYLPVLPPISIASLSSAHLGGYSLANNPVANGNIKDAPELGDFRQTTATGQGGLAPHTLQAIGNSYAHPNIPADRAFTTYIRRLNMDQPAEAQEIAYADHSYLANKALWDDFFFSSVTPKGQTVSKDPVPKSGYYRAEFAYQPEGEGDLQRITEQHWWHDAASRHVGFIVNTGGMLPRIYFYRDFR